MIWLAKGFQFKNYFPKFFFDYFCILTLFSTKCSQIIITAHEKVPLVYFYTPWKHSKTFRFLMFSRGMEREQWHEMGKVALVSLLSLLTTLRLHCLFGKSTAQYIQVITSSPDALSLELFLRITRRLRTISVKGYFCIAND